MPKNFSSALAMLIIGSLLISLTLIVEMPEIVLWVLLLLSLPLNIIGIVGVISHSTTTKNEVL